MSHWCCPGCPVFINTSLSFFDDYRVVSGVPVFVLSYPERITGASDPIKHVATDKCSQTMPSSIDDVREVDAQHSDLEPLGAGRACTQATRATFCRDGTRYVTGHKSGSVCVWDADHGKLLHALLDAHTHRVSHVLKSQTVPTTPFQKNSLEQVTS